MISRQLKFLLMMASAFVVMGISSAAFAQDATAVEVARLGTGSWIAIAAGLTIGLAAFGGALGQGRTAAAALEGIARNPASADRIFTPDDSRSRPHRVAGHLRAHHRLSSPGKDRLSLRHRAVGGPGHHPRAAFLRPSCRAPGEFRPRAARLRRRADARQGSWATNVTYQNHTEKTCNPKR